MGTVLKNNTPKGDLIQPVVNPPRETREGSSALRMRRLRERRRAGGTRVFSVEVGAEAMEFLIQQGLLFRENSGRLPCSGNCSTGGLDRMGSNQVSPETDGPLSARKRDDPMDAELDTLKNAAICRQSSLVAPGPARDASPGLLYGNPRGPLFGPDWPGRRCLAQLRRKPGRLCQRPALRGKTRCSLHGGRSTGPKLKGLTTHRDLGAASPGPVLPESTVSLNLILAKLRAKARAARRGSI